MCELVKIRNENGQVTGSYWRIIGIVPKETTEKKAENEQGIQQEDQHRETEKPTVGESAPIVNNINISSSQPVETGTENPSLGGFLEPVINKIPAEMKKRKQWVYWRAEEKAPGEKPAKIPYMNQTHRAKPNDSITWQEIKKLENWQETGMTGIGFVLSESDPYTIIDLDKCVVDGQWNDFAEKTVKAFDSYTELSPSGTGLHIIIKGKTEKAVKTDKIEIYYSKRYMAMTGIILLDKPISDRQIMLDKAIMKLRPKKKNNGFSISPPKNGNGKFTMPQEIFPDGQRNNSLAMWAGVLLKKGYSESEYFGWLKEINQKCCSPPLPESEVIAIGNSIKRY